MASILGYLFCEITCCLNSFEIFIKISVFLLVVFVLFSSQSNISITLFEATTSSYLRFREIQLPRELGALAAHDVLAPLELELEPVQLLGREGGPSALGPVQVEALRQDDLPDGAFGVCAE